MVLHKHTWIWLSFTYFICSSLVKLKTCHVALNRKVAEGICVLLVFTLMFPTFYTPTYNKVRYYVIPFEKCVFVRVCPRMYINNKLNWERINDFLQLSSTNKYILIVVAKLREHECFAIPPFHHCLYYSFFWFRLIKQSGC